VFQPIHAFVTVVLDPKNKKTPGGLVLPDGFGDIFITGVVRLSAPAGGTAASRSPRMSSQEIA
jgi:co-chaperonin GroES (HSP10)